MVGSICKNHLILVLGYKRPYTGESRAGSHVGAGAAFGRIDFSYGALPDPLRAYDAAVVQQLEADDYLVCTGAYPVQAGAGGVV